MAFLRVSCAGARFHHRLAARAQRTGLGLVGRQRHGGQCVEGYVQFLAAAAAIDDGCGGDDAGTRRTSHLNGFARGASGRHDILNDQHPIVGVQGKTAPQRQRPVLAFGKDGTDTKRPCDFVTDNNAAQGRRQNHGRPQGADTVGDPGAAGLGLTWMLQDKGALQVAWAVQPGSQPEVAFEQRPDTPEQIENVFSSGG